MPIITLTTDFGEKDHFVGGVKGAIYNEMDSVYRIVDITHIPFPPFILPRRLTSFKMHIEAFLAGTIHIIGIDSGIDPGKQTCCRSYLDGHYFMCANNGIISMLTSEINPEKIVEINIHDRVESNFPVLDVFVKVACHIAREAEP